MMDDLNHNALTLLYGCTNPAACNFDFFTDCIDLSQLENEWGGPCEYLDDGSCVFSGCTDFQACNFDVSAGCDDGSCEYPDIIMECGGNCWVDDDEDLICDDADQCTELEACNYDDPANEPCLFSDNIYNCGDVCYDPFLDGPLTLEGNVVGGTLQASAEGAALGQVSLEVNNFTYGPFPTTVITQTPFSIPVLDGVCNTSNFTLLWEHEFCYNALTTLYEGYAHITSTDEGIDCSGDCLEGEDDDNNGVCDDQEVYGCSYPLAENFSSSVTRDDGSCIFPCEGVVNTNVFDWDGDYVVTVTDFLMMLSVYGDTDVDLDGVWDSGDDCVDTNACNYANDPSEPCAYIDVLGVCGDGCEGDEDNDGICDDIDNCIGVEDECGVCNGPGAFYDCGCEGIPSSDCDCDGNVEDAIGTCGGDCPLDANADGICDTDQTEGCTYPAACNYNPYATFEDGSCDFFSCVVPGCTDPSACDYDPEATNEDGSCSYPGCIDPLACNFDGDAGCDDGSCTYPGCTAPSA